MKHCKMSRKWAMPSGETFSIDVVKLLVKRHLRESACSIDPFARNNLWATYTNDLNPDTSAEYHIDALEFLLMLEKKGVRADLVLFDPPYSRAQKKRLYQNIGKAYGLDEHREMSTNWRKERDAIDDMLMPGGVVVSFGWNSSGMGKTRGYKIEEILLINHGAQHHDTIVVVERRMGVQAALFDA